MGGWMKVPDHLLDLILKKLESPIDYLQFAATCKSWNSLVKFNKSTIRPLMDHQVPKLLLQSDPNGENTWCHTYDALSEKFIGPKQFVPHGRRFSGSSNGWLVIVDAYYNVKLHKPCFRDADVPTTTNTVYLPCFLPPDGVTYSPPLELADIESYISYEHGEGLQTPSDYYIHKAAISGDPMENPKECVVVVIFGDHRRLAFCTLATMSWSTVIETEENYYAPYADILHHSNRFYALNDIRQVVAFDVPDGSSDPVVSVVVPNNDDSRSSYGIQYLVRSLEGEFWHVYRDFVWQGGYRHNRMTTNFKVSKLDTDVGRWVEIKSLGDATLFLGDNTSICVSASKHIGCRPNCIYFTHDEDDIAKWGIMYTFDVGMYDMSSKIIEWYHGIDEDTIGAMYKQPPIWILPSPIL